MVMFTPVNGRTTRHMALASTNIPMALNTKVTGWKISNMEKVKKPGLITHSMRGNTREELSMEEAYLFGRMDHATLVSSWKTILKGMVSTRGPMAASIEASGNVTRWRALVSSNGKMEEGTKVNTSMTKRKDTECSPGLMVDSMMVSGKAVSNMASASIVRYAEKSHMATGTQESARTGLRNDQEG